MTMERQDEPARQVPTTPQHPVIRPLGRASEFLPPSRLVAITSFAARMPKVDEMVSMGIDEFTKAVATGSSLHGTLRWIGGDRLRSGPS
jgi:hypothetical protein